MLRLLISLTSERYLYHFFDRCLYIYDRILREDSDSNADLFPLRRRTVRRVDDSDDSSSSSSSDDHYIRMECNDDDDDDDQDENDSSEVENVAH